MVLHDVATPNGLSVPWLGTQKTEIIAFFLSLFSLFVHCMMAKGLSVLCGQRSS